MGALLSNPTVQKILAWIASWIWKKIEAKIREQIAEQEINARVQIKVKEILDKYEKIVLEFDELKDSGKLTEADKERIRNEKIRLETDLLNGVSR